MKIVKQSDDIQDIIDVNKRSAYTKTAIRIIELSSLSDIIPSKTAEEIRYSLLKRNVRVMQLTNHVSLEPWTAVSDFVRSCMQVRYVTPEVLPINVEVLMFDDTVAFYTVKPTVSVLIIEGSDFARQQEAIFDSVWKVSAESQLNPDGSTTMAVTINRAPADVFEYISDLENWREFSDFAANFEKKSSGHYIAHTPQGDITVLAMFDKKRMLLDTQCILPSGEIQTIPYRVVPNRGGSELIMTNFCGESVSRQDYNEQLDWMNIELQKVKQLLEARK